MTIVGKWLLYSRFVLPSHVAVKLAGFKMIEMNEDVRVRRGFTAVHRGGIIAVMQFVTNTCLGRAGLG